MALNPKQQRFCREYIIDLNATQAAIRAGYSKKTAASIGEEHLRKPEIAHYVNKLKAEREQRLEVSADDVLRQILYLAKADPRQVLHEDGTFRPISEWPDEVAACVAAIEFEDRSGAGKDAKRVREIKKIKWWDKTKALEMLARHKALFTDKVDLTTDGKPLKPVDGAGIIAATSKAISDVVRQLREEY